MTKHVSHWPQIDSESSHSGSLCKWDWPILQDWGGSKRWEPHIQIEKELLQGKMLQFHRLSRPISFAFTHAYSRSKFHQVQEQASTWTCNECRHSLITTLSPLHIEARFYNEVEGIHSERCWLHGASPQRRELSSEVPQQSTIPTIPRCCLTWGYGNHRGPLSNPQAPHMELWMPIFYLHPFKGEMALPQIFLII